MNPKYQKVIDCIFPLSDALQMPLDFHDISGKYSLTGKVTMALPVSDHASIDFKSKVLASRVSTTGTWVLFRVKGMLWAFASYAPDAKELNFMLLDALMMPSLKESEVEKEFNGKPLADVVVKLRKAEVATFRKDRNAETWERTDVIGDMDAGPTGSSDEGSWGLSQASLN